MKSRYARRIEAMDKELRVKPELRYSEQIQEIVLANLYHLRPNLPWPDTVAAARTLYRNQRRATIDLQHLAELIPKVVVDDRTDGVVSRGPAIFCASHYAGYRLIAPILLSLGMAVTIVIDKHVARAQADMFSGALRKHCRRLGFPNDRFAFRDTSEHGLLLGLARDVRAGRSLLFYLDGNSGIDSSTARNDHTVAVDFLGHSLSSRTGIPQISAMTKAPVVPVRMSRAESLEGNFAEFLQPMQFDGGDRDAFVRATLQTLWSLIGEQVDRDPTQWESLRYINKFVEFGARRPSPAERLSSDVVIFDFDRFSVRTDLREKIVFDRRTMLLYPIGDAVADLLDRLVRMPSGADLVRSDLPSSVVDWLIAKQFAVRGEQEPAIPEIDEQRAG
jgi:hypothetical protein